jgi:hypothetical protein
MDKIYFILWSLIFLSLGILIGVYLDMYYQPYFIFQNQAPSNYINESQIHIYNDSVCIDIINASLSSYTATGSMTPTLSERADGIEIPIIDKSQINLGDLITYSKDNETIIHRVIEIGIDMDGWYIKEKGDFNIGIDEKIRWEQIKYKTIVLIY